VSWMPAILRIHLAPTLTLLRFKCSLVPAGKGGNLELLPPLAGEGWDGAKGGAGGRSALETCAHGTPIKRVVSFRKKIIDYAPAATSSRPPCSNRSRLIDSIMAVAAESQ